MSAADVKEIVYHCECRRFVKGTPTEPCFCHECGREHAPSDPPVATSVTAAAS